MIHAWLPLRAGLMSDVGLLTTVCISKRRVRVAIGFCARSDLVHVCVFSHDIPIFLPVDILPREIQALVWLQNHDAEILRSLQCIKQLSLIHI